MGLLSGLHCCALQNVLSCLSCSVVHCYLQNMKDLLWTCNLRHPWSPIISNPCILHFPLVHPQQNTTIERGVYVNFNLVTSGTKDSRLLHVIILIKLHPASVSTGHPITSTLRTRKWWRLLPPRDANYPKLKKWQTIFLIFIEQNVVRCNWLCSLWHCSVFPIEDVKQVKPHECPVLKPQVRNSKWAQSCQKRTWLWTNNSSFFVPLWIQTLCVFLWNF